MSTMSPFRDRAELETATFAPEYGEELRLDEPEFFAVPPAEAEAKAEAETPPIPSSRLEWPGASADKLAFMRAVYERHFDNSMRSGRPFVANLQPHELDVIDEGYQGRTDAAAAARDLLAAARAALAAEGLDGKLRVGVISAYRPAEHQFGIWEGKGRNEKAGFPYYYKEAMKENVVSVEDYGPTAVERMAHYIGQYIASPGFSNHQDGLAIDFGMGSVGRDDFNAIRLESWFHHWLVANADRFDYHPYVKEPWHWTYRKPASPAREYDLPPGAIEHKRIPVAHVRLLASHRGRGARICCLAGTTWPPLRRRSMSLSTCTGSGSRPSTCTGTSSPSAASISCRRRARPARHGRVRR